MEPVLYHIYDELGAERIAFLKSLPPQIGLTLQGITLKVCHNPSKLKVFTVPDRLRRKSAVPNREALRLVAESLEGNLCIFGHYHLFMDEIIEGKRFICAGSVGLPLDCDPRAKYMILDIQDGDITCTKQYVCYDRSRLADDFERKGYFEKYDVWSMNTLVTMMTECNYIGTQDLRKA